MPMSGLQPVRVFQTFTMVLPKNKFTQTVMNHGMTRGEATDAVRRDAQIHYKMAVRLGDYREI